MKTKLHHAMGTSFTIEGIFNLTKIDRWFSGAGQRERGTGGCEKLMFINP
jgi:hypothetical protein